MNDLDQFGRSRIQIGVDELVLERIPPVTLHLTWILFCYSGFDLFFLPAPHSHVAALIVAAVGICFAFAHLLAAQGLIPSRLASRTCALLAILAMATSFPMMVLLHDSHMSVNLLLIVFASSLFIGSRFWFGMVAAVIAGGWTVFLFMERLSVSPHYTAALYTGVVLSLVVNNIQRRMLHRMVTVKMQAQEHAAELVKTSRQALSATALVRAVVEGTSDPVYVKDREGRYLMVNPAYVRDLGRLREQLIGRTATEVYGPEEGEKIAAVENAVLESGKGRVVEEYASSNQQTYLCNSFPYFDQNGEIAGVIGISRNITTRKQHEEQLASMVSQLVAAKSQADAANRVKSDFLAAMSHEIRTPMNGVLGMAQLLLNTPLAAQQSEYVGTIYQSAETLLSVINDILDFSKIEAGKMDMEEVPFSLEEQLRRTTSVIEQRAAGKGLDLRIELSPGLPATIISDPTRLGQVVLNLLSNAVKFTEAGSIVVKVSALRTGHQTVRLRISVEDTGIGIAPDQLEQIFEKFSQADSSTTRRYGGTGLGLAIGRQLVRLMGGELGVDSKVGIGSTFWLEVPVRVSREKKKLLPGATALATESQQQTDVKGLRVLLVEDNIINQKVALSMLKRLGCEAEHAADGLVAVEMACRGHYDLILMDVEMPRMNGFEATREIQRTLGETAPPIVALTAHAIVGYREQCWAAGMQDYLTKPLHAKDLAETVGKFVSPKPPAALGADVAGNNDLAQASTQG